MKMLKFALLLCLAGCGGKQEPDRDVFDRPVKTNEEQPKDFMERVKREVEAKLSIPATEKYDLQVYYAHLNADEKKDAVITVNRLDFAIDEAAKSENPAKRAELGYMGAYNHFFYYDGKRDDISVPVVIASSAKAPLKIKFENIQSEFYQDITVEYRIRNSAFRNYYLMQGNNLQLVFQWKLFDQAGLDYYEANYITFDRGTMSLAKDILIYKGQIKNYSKNIPDVYKYNPEILKKDELLYRFFYDTRTMKYMTKQGAPTS